MAPDNRLGVALDALRSDAKTWDHAADSLNGPLNKVGSLRVTGEQASSAAVEVGLVDTFEKARTTFEDVVRQAASYFNQIGSDLRTAANEYQTDDEHGRHHIQSAYGMQGDIYGG